MKSQFIFLTNEKSGKFFIPLLAILSFILLGCNQKKDNENSKNKNDTVISEPNQTGNTTTQAALLSGDLYTLKLTKVQYDSLKKYSGSKKMIMQFFFKTSNPNSPTLLAYPAKPANKYYTNNTSSLYNPVELTTDQPFMKVEPKMILGDQQISYVDIDNYLRVSGVNISNPYTLTFSPDSDATNHVYYKITVAGAAAAAAPLQTNPSPPKDAD